MLNVQVTSRVKKLGTKKIPALTPNRCKNNQLYYIVHANQGTQSGRQVWETSVGDKWKTSVNSAQRTQSGRQVWETRVGDKCGRQVGDKCKLSPKNPEWETSVGDKWETSVNSCAPRHPEWVIRVGDKWETSVKSCGPRHPEWETSGRQV